MDLIIDKYFIKDKNPHKYALMYSSKCYIIINKTLRNNEINELMKSETTSIFIIGFIKYFYEYGIYKETIVKKIKYLYRGLSSDFKYVIEKGKMQERGFIFVYINNKRHQCSTLFCKYKWQYIEIQNKQITRKCSIRSY